MTIAVLSSFLLDWFAVALEWRKIKPVSKILAMVMVILWTLSVAGWSPDALIILLLLAQLFGLSGDIFLLLADRWFFAGLGAFLIGHIFYTAIIFIDIISSINANLRMHSFIVALIVAVIFWGLVLLIIYRFFKRDYFIKHNKGKRLWTLVQIYIWGLSGLTALTVFRILIQYEPTVQMVLLPIGALLFLLSDIILAYDRFVKPILKGQLWVHMTYHLGQFSLAVGFLSIMGRI